MSKKLRLFIVFTLVALCAFGCGKKTKKKPVEPAKKNSEPAATENVTVTSFYDNYSCFSSLGLTEININGFLCNTEMETGEITYKCTIEGCRHEEAEDKTKCEACVPDNLSGVLVDSDYIYLYGWSDDSGNFLLFRENADGSGRQLVAENSEVNGETYEFRFAAASKSELVIGFQSDDNDEFIEAGLLVVDKDELTVSPLFFDEFGAIDSMTLYGNRVICRIGENCVKQYDTAVGSIVKTITDVAADVFVCDTFMAAINAETGEIVLSYFEEPADERPIWFELSDTKYGARYYPQACIDGKLLVKKEVEGENAVWKSLDLVTGEEAVLGADNIEIVFCDGAYLYGYTIDNMLFKRSLEHLCTFWPSADDVSSYEYEVYGSDTVVMGIIGLTDDRYDRYSEISESVSGQLAAMGEDFGVAIKCIKMSDWLSSGLSLKEYVESYYPDVDILKIPYVDPYQGIKDGLYIPLDEYLKSDAGSALYNAIPEIKWKECSYNGQIYSVPNTTINDYGNYLLFNKKYVSEEAAGAWDGSYEGLEAILGNTGVTEPQYNYIVYHTLNSDFENGTFNNGLYFDEEKGTVVPWYDTEGLKEYYGFLNRLYLSGSLGETSMNNDDSLVSDYYTGFLDRMVKDGADFGFGIIAGFGEALPDHIGQYDYMLRRAEHYVGSKINLSLGIYSGTDCKENALKLLNYMYTDKDIINLFIYGDDYDPETHTVNDSAEYSNFIIDGFNFGNWAMAESIESDDADERYKTMWECAEKYSREGAFIGKAFDFSGYEDVGAELEELRMEYIDIWKSEDFDSAWNEMITDVTDGKYTEYAEAVLNSAS